MFLLCAWLSFERPSCCCLVEGSALFLFLCPQLQLVQGDEDFQRGLIFN